MRINIVTTVILLFASSVSQSLAAPEDCEFIGVSYAKLVDLPYKQIITVEGKVTGEFVSMDNMLYANVDGSWDSMPYAEKARRANMTQLFDKLSIKECSKQPDSEHLGKPVHVYNYIVPPMDGISTEPTTQTIFIGADDGLPYQMTAGTMMVDLTFENISVPAQ